VVGGGLVGSSVAYHLAQVGVDTLLVEQGNLASGASGANFGRIQVQDAEFGLSLELTLESFARFTALETELDYDLGYRTAGYVLLIENERQWAQMEMRAAALQIVGVNARLIDASELLQLEPHLSPEMVVGALYNADEGQLNPFALVHAYALRGRDRGLEVWTHTQVKEVQSQGGRVTAVDTSRGRVFAKWVILAAGAGTRQLGHTVGIDIPVLWVHGEALVTEQLPPLARNGMLSASFFEETEGGEGQTVGFCLTQRPEGNTMIGEAAFVTDRVSRHVTSAALPAVVAKAERYLPDLRRARVLRGWASPVPFTADNQPLLGPVEGLDGLIVATGLKSTIILTPLVGELVANMVTGGRVDPRLEAFSPGRNMGAHEGVAA
jgi:sarcosine oxidase subunit beta